MSEDRKTQWDEIEESPEFQSLAPKEKIEAANYYLGRLSDSLKDDLAGNPEAQEHFRQKSKEFLFKFAENHLPNALVSFPGQVAESFAREERAMLRKGAAVNTKIGLEAQSTLDKISGLPDDQIIPGNPDEFKTVAPSVDTPAGEYKQYLRSVVEAQSVKGGRKTEKLAKSFLESSERTPSATMFQLELSEGWAGWDDFIAKNWKQEKGAVSKVVDLIGSIGGAVIGLNAESSVQSGKGMAAAIGTTLATGNPIAGGAAAAAVAFESEFQATYLSELQEELKKRGGDISSKAIQEVLADPEFNERVDKKAKIRGAAIGATEGVAGWLSGQIANKVGSKTLGKALVATGLDTAGNVVGGSGGEFIARLFSGDDIWTPEARKEILSEGVAEIGQGVSAVAMSTLKGATGGFSEADQDAAQEAPAGGKEATQRPLPPGTRRIQRWDDGEETPSMPLSPEARWPRRWEDSQETPLEFSPESVQRAEAILNQDPTVPAPEAPTDAPASEAPSAKPPVVDPNAPLTSVLDETVEEDPELVAARELHDVTLREGDRVIEEVVNAPDIVAAEETAQRLREDPITPMPALAEAVEDAASEAKAQRMEEGLSALEQEATEAADIVSEDIEAERAASGNAEESASAPDYSSTQRGQRGEVTGKVPEGIESDVDAAASAGIHVHFGSAQELTSLSEQHGAKVDFDGAMPGIRRNGVFTARSGVRRIYVATDRTRNAGRTLAHEARHAANDIGRENHPDEHAAAVASLQGEAALMSAAADVYPGFSRLSPERQLSEVMSLLADGRLRISDMTSPILAWVRRFVAFVKNTKEVRLPKEILAYADRLESLLASPAEVATQEASQPAVETATQPETQQPASEPQTVESFEVPERNLSVRVVQKPDGTFGVEKTNTQTGRKVPFVNAPESFPTKVEALGYLQNAFQRTESINQAAQEATPAETPVRIEDDPLLNLIAEEKMQPPPARSIADQGDRFRREQRGLQQNERASQRRGDYERAPLIGEFRGPAREMVRKFYKEDSGNRPDQVAEMAYARGLISEPSVDALFQAVRERLDGDAGRTSQAAVSDAAVAETVARQDELVAQGPEAFFDSIASPMRSGDVVKAGLLDVGDVLTVDDDRVTVIDKDDDDGTVTVRSDKFGQFELGEDNDVGYDSLQEAGEPISERDGAPKDATVTESEAEGLTKKMQSYRSLRGSSALASRIHSKLTNRRNLNAARRIAKLFGYRVVGVENSRGNAFIIPGDNKNIYIARDATRPEIVLAMHELFHRMKEDAPDLYNGLLGLLGATLDENGKVVSVTDADLAAYVEQFRKNFKGDSVDLQVEELLADYVTELAGKREFWENLGARDPGMFEKIADYIIRFLQDITDKISENGVKVEQFFQDAAAIRNEIEAALVAYRYRRAELVQHIEETGVQIADPDTYTPFSDRINSSAVEISQAEETVESLIGRESLSKLSAPVDSILLKGGVEIEVRDPSENVTRVAQSSGKDAGAKLGTLPISELSGSIRLNQPEERNRVDSLKNKIISDGGFISSLIVDSSGEVIEGQHRLAALSELGASEVPVVVLYESGDFIPDVSALERVLSGERLRGDQISQFIQNIGEVLMDENGDVSELRNYDAPNGFEREWNAAVSEIERQAQSIKFSDRRPQQSAEDAGGFYNAEKIAKINYLSTAYKNSMASLGSKTIRELERELKGPFKYISHQRPASDVAPDNSMVIDRGGFGAFSTDAPLPIQEVERLNITPVGVAMEDLVSGLVFSGLEIENQTATGGTSRLLFTPNLKTGGIRVTNLDSNGEPWGHFDDFDKALRSKPGTWASVDRILNGNAFDLSGEALPAKAARQDARYLELAEDPEGNREELWEMVYKAGESAGFMLSNRYDYDNDTGYMPWLHGSRKEDIRVFEGIGDFFFFTDEDFVAESFGSIVYKSMLRLGNALYVDAEGSDKYSIKFEGKEYDVEDLMFLAKDRGFESVVIENVIDNASGYTEPATVAVVFSANQIKSADPADPVTYDADGNVIPLSKRFDSGSDDIRFSDRRVSPAEDANYLRLAADPVANEQELQRAVAEAASSMMPNTAAREDLRDAETWKPGYRAQGLPKVLFWGGPSDVELSAVGNRGDRDYLHGEGIWLTGDSGIGAENEMREYAASTYASNFDNGTVRQFFANIQNPAFIYDSDIVRDKISIESLRSRGHDGARLMQSGMWVAFSPDQLIDASPVVYDESGNVIPLSKRFDSGNDDIRFSDRRPDRSAEVSRFNELTADLYEGRNEVTAEEIEAWKSANPEKWQELSEMREEVLREAGYLIESLHGTNGDEFTVFDIERGGDKTAAESAAMGIFSTDNLNVAEIYASNMGMGGAMSLAFGNENDPLVRARSEALASPEGKRLSAEWESAKQNVQDVFGSEFEKLKQGIREKIQKGRSQGALKDVDDTMLEKMVDAVAQGEFFRSNESNDNPAIREAYQKEKEAENALHEYVRPIIDAAIPNKRVLKLRLKLENPAIYDANGQTPGTFPLSKKIAAAKAEGRDGVIFENIVDPDESATHYVVFDPSQIKSADPISPGPKVTPDQWADDGSDDIRFSDRRTNRLPQEKYDRHADLESKNNAGTITEEERAEAQGIVEEAAKRAGYDIGPVWHGSTAMSYDNKQKGLPFSVFDKAKRELGFHFGSEEQARERSGVKSGMRNMFRGYLKGPFGATVDTYNFSREPWRHVLLAANLSFEKLKDPQREESTYWASKDEKRRRHEAIADIVEGFPSEIREDLPKDAIKQANELEEKKLAALKEVVKTPDDAAKLLESIGFFGLAYPNRVEGDPGGISYLVFEPNQIKSAEPFTGVPLEQRFDVESDDIRFSDRRVSPAHDNILKTLIANANDGYANDVETDPLEGGKVRSIAKQLHKLHRESDRIVWDKNWKGRKKNFAPGQEAKFMRDVTRASGRMVEALRMARAIFPNFQSWYESRLKMAMDIFAEMDEDAKKPENNFVLRTLLSITSNGNKVNDQTSDSWGIYQEWKRTGRLNNSANVSGTRTKEIRKTLEKVDLMLARHGWEKVDEFLKSSGTVAELRGILVEDFYFTQEEAVSATTGELADEVVPFSLIFGPKLGSFFNNLSGNFNTTTMDRWFMRTFGRALGSQLTKVTKEEIAEKRTRLEKAIAAAKKTEQGRFVLKAAGVKPSATATNNTAIRLAKYFEKAENREGIAEGSPVDVLRLSANGLFKIADGYRLEEAPKNGGHRRFIRLVMDKARDTFNEETGQEWSAAEIQALLWYFEKHVHDTYGSKQTDDTPDYGSAANRLFRRERGGSDAGAFKPSDAIRRGGGEGARLGQLDGSSAQGAGARVDGDGIRFSDFRDTGGEGYESDLPRHQYFGQRNGPEYESEALAPIIEELRLNFFDEEQEVNSASVIEAYGLVQQIDAGQIDASKATGSDAGNQLLLGMLWRFASRMAQEGDMGLWKVMYPKLNEYFGVGSGTAMARGLNSRKQFLTHMEELAHQVSQNKKRIISLVAPVVDGKVTDAAAEISQAETDVQREAVRIGLERIGETEVDQAEEQAQAAPQAQTQDELQLDDREKAVAGDVLGSKAKRAGAKAKAVLKGLLDDITGLLGDDVRFSDERNDESRNKEVAAKLILQQASVARKPLSKKRFVDNLKELGIPADKAEAAFNMASSRRKELQDALKADEAERKKTTKAKTVAQKIADALTAEARRLDRLNSRVAKAAERYAAGRKARKKSESKKEGWQAVVENAIKSGDNFDREATILALQKAEVDEENAVSMADAIAARIAEGRATSRKARTPMEIAEDVLGKLRTNEPSKRVSKETLNKFIRKAAVGTKAMSLSDFRKEATGFGLTQEQADSIFEEIAEIRRNREEAKKARAEERKAARAKPPKSPADIAKEIIDRYKNPVQSKIRQRNPVNALVNDAVRGKEPMQQSTFVNQAKALGIPQAEADAIWNDVVDLREARAEVIKQKLAERKQAQEENAGRIEAMRLIKRLAQSQSDTQDNRPNTREPSNIEQYYRDLLRDGPPMAMVKFRELLAEENVDATEADKLYTLAMKERMNRAKVDSAKRASNAIKRSASFIKAELLKNPALSFVGPAERLAISTRMFQELGGLSLAEARVAARDFDGFFVGVRKEAAQKIFEAYAAKRNAPGFRGNAFEKVLARGKDLINEESGPSIGGKKQFVIQEESVRDAAINLYGDLLQRPNLESKDVYDAFREIGVPDKIASGLAMVLADTTKTKEKKNFFDQMREALRAHAYDPSKRVLDEVAKANGWYDLTDTELQQLHELDAKLNGLLITYAERQELDALNEKMPNLSEAEKKRFEELEAKTRGRAVTDAEVLKIKADMARIINRSRLDLDIKKNFREYLLANAFSSVRTWGLQLSAIFSLADNVFVRDLPDAFLGSVQKSDMINLSGWLSAAVMRWPTHFRNAWADSRLAMKQGIVRGVQDEEIVNAVSRLQMSYDKNWAIINNPNATVAQKGWAATKVFLVTTRFALRILGALDGFTQGLIRSYTHDLELFSKAAGMGLSREDIGALMTATDQALKSAKEEGAARGYEGAMLSAYANDKAAMAMYDGFAGIGMERDFMEESQRRSLREAGYETGVGHIEVNGVIPIASLAQAIQKWSSNQDSALGALTTLVAMVVRTPFNMAHRSAQKTPWGFARVLRVNRKTRGATAWKQGDNLLSPYERSMADPYQYRRRRAEAMMGTFMFSVTAALLLKSLGEDDEEKQWFRINLGGPPDKEEQAAWRATGRRRFTAQFKVFGRWRTFGFRGGAFEALNIPMTILGSWEQRKYSAAARAGEHEWEKYLLTLGEELGGEALFFLRPFTSRRVSTKKETIGSQLGFYSSTLVPFTSMLKMVNRFSRDKQDPDGFVEAVLMQWPIVPLLGEDRPMLNSLGHPIETREKGGFWLANVGIPVGTAPVAKEPQTQEEVDLESIYRLMLKQGYFPSVKSQSQFGEDVDMDTYRQFVQKRGEAITEYMRRNYFRLSKMDSEKFKDAVRKVSSDATARTQRQMRIR